MSAYPLYVSDTPAKGSFPHLANMNTEVNASAIEHVMIMNLSIFLQSNFSLETNVPLMIWPRAAPGTRTTPREKQGTNGKRKSDEFKT